MRKIAGIIFPLLVALWAGCAPNVVEENQTVEPSAPISKTTPAKPLPVATAPSLAPAKSPAVTAAVSPGPAAKYCTPPLRISHIEGAWLSQTRSVNGTGVCWGFYNAEKINDDNARFGWIFDSDNIWLQHTDLSMAPAWLYIYQNSSPVNVQSGDYVTIKYDGGKQLRIYPPALSKVSGALFIAANGSTYYDQGLCNLAKAAPPIK